MKKSFPILLIPVLLSGCNRTPLRSDIKEFVTSFSLDECIKTYHDMGYEEVTTIKKETEEIRNTKVDIISSEGRDFSYQYTYTSYIDGELTTSRWKTLIYEEGSYYLSSNDMPTPQVVSEDKKYEYIEDFFFQEIVHDYYHDKGMYYGDIVLAKVRNWQKYTTIDLENNLLIVDYPNHIYDDDLVQEIDKTVVNHLGMLVNKQSKMVQKSTNYSSETVIDVYF